MDTPPLTPSIMGSENPKFSDRRMDMSESEENSDSQKNDSVGNARDGLSREERQKLVRIRQMEEQSRRIDELRQHQIQVMRAKRQFCDERQRKLDEIKQREDQRKAAVDARRRRIEEEEQNRRDAILRKHQEIFERIEEKKRQHESRRAVFGQSSNRLTDQDSVYTNVQSRRAVSAGHLSSRHQNLTARPHYKSTVISPASKSARTHTASPGTPSKSGGFGESISGSASKTTSSSSDNSPVHSARPSAHHYRVVSQPPVTRKRGSGDAKSRQGSRPQTSRGEKPSTPSARPPRPTSLMTRSLHVEKKSPAVQIDVHSPTTPASDTSSFKIISKRSQSVGNVSARSQNTARKKDPPETPKMRAASSSRQVHADSPSTPVQTESESTSRSKKITSEAEAKAALAEKRRLARLKAEADRGQTTASADQGVTVEEVVGESVSGNLADSPVPVREKQEEADELVARRRKSVERNALLDLPDRRNSVFTLDEFQKAEAEIQAETAEREHHDTEMAVAHEHQHPTVTPVQNRNQSAEFVNENQMVDMPEIVRDAEQSESRQRRLSVGDDDASFAVELKAVEDSSTSALVLEDKTPVQLTPTESDGLVVPESVHSVSPTPSSVQDHPSSVDPARDELTRRRIEMEQKEEEERNQRKLRLEAIRNLTKGKGGFAGSTERLSSPASETAKPIDVVENARKLLNRRRGNGTEPSTPMTENVDMSAMTRSFSGVAFTQHPEVDAAAKTNGHMTNGTVDTMGGGDASTADDELDPFRADFTKSSSPPRLDVNSTSFYQQSAGKMRSDLLLNFDDL